MGCIAGLLGVSSGLFASLVPGADALRAGLEVEWKRMEIINQNLANINTTKGPDGKAYQKQTMALTWYQDPATGQYLPQVTGVVKDEKPGILVYKPEHPHANDQGYVELPNVDLAATKVDAMETANSIRSLLSAQKLSRQMALNRINIAFGN